MNKHLIVIGVVIILLAVAFSGCNEISSEEKLVGIWGTNSIFAIRDLGYRLTFYSNGTGLINYNISINWEIKGDKLIIEKLPEGNKTSYKFYMTKPDEFYRLNILIDNMYLEYIGN